MEQSWVEAYISLSKEHKNIIYQTDKNIIKFLLISDLLISDTSSVIYEFILLDKPVVSFNNISKNINWEDSNDFSQLVNLVENNLKDDPFAKSRTYICEQFHPYNDGKSALRMVNSVGDYIKEHGVPEKRKLSLLRRLKIYSIFGKPSKR